MSEYIVKIEKMINEGAGLARINNIPVFIDSACPNDVLKIKITKRNKSYLIGEIIEVIEPSQYRIKPVCALHNICGSCNWQHITYDEQLRQKQNIVKETLERFAGYKEDIKQIIPSPKVTEYRCKVQMPVAQTKVSKRILAGYYKKNSHELINIKFCHMQPTIINEINEFIKEQAQILNIDGYNEKNHTGILKHLVYRISSDLSQILVVLVVNSDVVDNKLKKLSELLFDNFTQIIGVCANFNTKKSNVILSKNTKQIVGKDFYIESLNNYNYQISDNSFFQVNPL